MTFAITSTIGCARPSGADLARKTLGAVGAEPGRRVVGDVADDHRRRLGAELAGELRRLRDRAERVLVEVALVVVEGVDQDPRHLDQLPFVEPGDDLLDRLVGVLVLDDLAGLLRGRRVDLEHLRLRAGLADLVGLDPDVAGAPCVSSGFFFAPMIAFSDG